MSLTAALRHKRHWRALRTEAFIQCEEQFPIGFNATFIDFHSLHQLQLGSIFNENCSPLTVTDHSIKLILKGIWVSIFLIQIISLPSEIRCIILMEPDQGQNSNAKCQEFRILESSVRNMERGVLWLRDNECEMKFGELCHLMKLFPGTTAGLAPHPVLIF